MLEPGIQEKYIANFGRERVGIFEKVENASHD